VTLPPVGSNLGPDPQFRRHIADVLPSLKEQFDALEHIESLMAHPGWDLVQRVLRAEVELIDRRLDGGSRPLEQAEYALAHGRRAGLLGADFAARAILAVTAASLEDQRRKYEGAPGVPEGAV
jgi:hypothetical protein